MIRLLIADDHQLFRQGLRRLLSEHADLSVVAEASNYDEVVAAVLAQPIDVAILDLSMPGRGGIPLIGHVKSLRPALRTLIMTMHGEDTYVMQALRAGTDGYMTKENASEEMVVAIRRLASGGKYVSPEIAERLTLGIGEQHSEQPMHTRLSRQEYRIFELLIAGKRGSEIAQELSLSEKTVSTHKAHVLKKMNLNNHTELVRYAIKHQLVPL
jgi:DNA-binding NarL/FixJ family response regulator